jgi:hypothetical protein
MIGFIKQKWEQAFEDWDELLHRANAEDLKEDPKAIWDEAWRHATFVCWAIVEEKAPITHRQSMLDEIKKRMLS